MGLGRNQNLYDAHLHAERAHGVCENASRISKAEWESGRLFKGRGDKKLKVWVHFVSKGSNPRARHRDDGLESAGSRPRRDRLARLPVAGALGRNSHEPEDGNDNRIVDRVGLI